MNDLSKIKTLAKRVEREEDNLGNINPLDGDDTELLADVFRLELDLQNGNVSNEEHARWIKIFEDKMIDRSLM